MNSERRHELQHNWLAGYLARINESIEPHSKLIAVVVGCVILAGLAYALIHSNASGNRSDATLQLALAAGEDDAETLAIVGERYGETTAGIWARLYQADELMARGLRVLYNDRTEATELLESARSAYQQSITGGNDKILRSRSHYGLARIAEALGNTDEAISEYREVIAANESEAMVKVAGQRIDSLSRPATQEFLAWFGDQDFSPPDPALPPALPSGTTLPDLPDLTLPDLDLGDDKAADPEMKADTATEADSSSSEIPAAETKPALETAPAAEDKPAAEAKPAAAETTPAEASPAEASPAETTADESP